MTQYVGFHVRFPPKLHERLTHEAKASGESAHALILRLIEKGLSEKEGRS